MAVTQLSIYNAALIEVGTAALTTLSDNRDERTSLDVFYTDLDYPSGALETAKPRFACRTKQSTGSASAESVQLEYTHGLPADYLSLVAIYSDAELDQPISRYILDSAGIICDYETIYIRYVRNDIAVASYSSLFVKYLSLLLAEAIAPKYASDRIEGITSRKNAALENLVAVEGEKEPVGRPAAQGSELSLTWRKIYNGALQILGKPKLPAGTIDHPWRVALDTTLESEVVEDVLFDTNWRFGTSVVRLTYDSTIEPSFGYPKAFTLPGDVLRIAGVFLDEFCLQNLDLFHEEDRVLYCNQEIIYLRYVDRDWVTQPAAWPPDVRRLVMAKMALDAANEIDATKYTVAESRYKEAKNTAIGNDIAQRPVTPITGGNWVRSRYKNDYEYRNRN
jgi:hypothetical protein